MSVSTNDLKRGMTLDLNGTLFQVIEFQHVKPGKGGAFVRTKLRNVKTGAVLERTFNARVGIDDGDPASMAEAMGQALDDAVAQVADAVRVSVRARGVHFPE